ncbi:ABC transporter permease [Methyloglobulus sp.]|uniref:ABC transporter permease n=1 Tax=Methyloglobulus sp. TaxID=2518622 RepID=UPI0032B79CAA
MIILWTDALILLLLFSSIGIGFYLHDKEHIQRPLNKIVRSKVGMVSLVVLVFFLLIGLLDSIHFKSNQENSSEIISLLDYCATPLREHNEKTYSAPFATTLYSKEMVEKDGSMQWDYPRQVYGGKHLDDPEKQQVSDIMLKAGIGFLQGLALFTAFLLLSAGVSYLKHSSAPQFFTVHPVMVTLFIIIVLSTISGYLSLYYHVLGTDKVGEDVFYQAIKSIRTGLVIGTLTTLIMLPMAILFGILAGFFRGWVDDVIQYLYTTLNSIPGVLLIAASVLMVQVYMANHEAEFTSLIVRADMRLLFLCMILGVTSWTGLCRLLRAETLKLREMEYVQAAYALGVKQHTILLRHILPNVMHIVLISVVLDFSSLVLAEAVLSYINIGVDPTTYSWGNMINGARLEMAREPIVWWSLSAAFVFMFALVLAANLFADVVQDAFDPRSMTNEASE